MPWYNGLYAGIALIVSRMFLGTEQQDDGRADELTAIVSVPTQVEPSRNRRARVNIRLKHVSSSVFPFFQIWSK